MDLRDADPVRWDHRAHGINGCIAQANAMLAWLFDDALTSLGANVSAHPQRRRGSGG